MAKLKLSRNGSTDETLRKKISSPPIFLKFKIQHWRENRQECRQRSVFSLSLVAGRKFNIIRGKRSVPLRDGPTEGLNDRRAI